MATQNLSCNQVISGYYCKIGKTVIREDSDHKWTVIVILQRLELYAYDMRVMVTTNIAVAGQTVGNLNVTVHSV